MHIFDGPYYCVNKYMLSMVGLWPYQRRLERAILFSGAVLWIVCLTISHVMVLFYSGKQWDILIETVSPLLIHGVATIKIVNSICNDDKIRTLIGRMEKNWNTIDISEKTNIMRKYAAGGRRTIVTYMIVLYMGWWFYSTMPVVTLLFEFLSPMNESHVLKPLYRYDFFLDVQKYQYEIFFFCTGGVFIILTVGVACDSLFVCFAQHVCGLFAMVQYDVEHIQEDESLNIDLVPPIANDEPYQKIIKCIHKYNEALDFEITNFQRNEQFLRHVTFAIFVHDIRFTDILASAYTTAFLFLVGFVMIDLSFTGAEMALHANSFENVVRFAAEGMGEIAHFYFNTLPCQKIIDYSLLIREAVYSCHWYRVSLRSRKMLAFVLLRSGKPCQITAAHIYVMSMENFSAVLRASMSYFTMLMSMQ